GLFANGEVSHDWYDGAPVATGIRQDNSAATLSAGVRANWRDVLVGEASVGYSLRRFDDPSIASLAATVFGLDLSYTPNNAFSASAGFSTTLTPQDVGAGRAASVDYAASLDLGLRLAPWVGLRASAAGAWAVPVSGPNIRTTYSGGAGMDFAINRNVAVNADYLFTWTQPLPSPAEYAHAATIGITVSR
ncbi:MAG TPA: hypothetical protein ENJ68_04405, partial [Devosia sp.]|nr:hypothetical protein [Devosia sp.]